MSTQGQDISPQISLKNPQTNTNNPVSRQQDKQDKTLIFL